MSVASDILESFKGYELAQREADSESVEINQDWDSETTFYVFSDRSEIRDNCGELTEV